MVFVKFFSATFELVSRTWSTIRSTGLNTLSSCAYKLSCSPLTMSETLIATRTVTMITTTNKNEDDRATTCVREMEPVANVVASVRLCPATQIVMARLYVQLCHFGHCRRE